MQKLPVQFPSFFAVFEILSDFHKPTPARTAHSQKSFLAGCRDRSKLGTPCVEQLEAHSFTVPLIVSLSSLFSFVFSVFLSSNSDTLFVAPQADFIFAGTSFVAVDRGLRLRNANIGSLFHAFLLWRVDLCAHT